MKAFLALAFVLILAACSGSRSLPTAGSAPVTMPGSATSVQVNGLTPEGVLPDGCNNPSTFRVCVKPGGSGQLKLKLTCKKSVARRSIAERSRGRRRPATRASRRSSNPILGIRPLRRSPLRKRSKSVTTRRTSPRSAPAFHTASRRAKVRSGSLSSGYA